MQTAATQLRMDTLDMRAFYEFIARCHSIQDREQFAQLVYVALADLLEHRMAACGFGDPADARIVDYINLGYPVDYVNWVVDRRNVIRSPVFTTWRRTQLPQYIDANSVYPQSPSDWLERFHVYELNNIAAHGLVDMSGRLTSYFTFSQLSQQGVERSEMLLELLAPHLHVAFARIIGAAAASCGAGANLTQRETEILKWVYAGKSNVEIGDQLRISQFTVKNHLHNINEKLGVRNRAHAVAKALSLGIIDH